MKEGLTQKMASVNYMATTADCWSRDKKSFLGVTAHWINNKTLDKESCALACKHIRGHHVVTLAREIWSISCTYKIQNKVVCMTTDNASNFVKCFKTFGIPYENENTKEEEEDNAEVISLTKILTLTFICHRIKDVQRFIPPEIELMKEYCDIMGLVAQSLVLQREAGMYMGYLLPILHFLEKKLAAREGKHMKYCLPLLSVVRSGIKKRFGAIWMEKLVIAACLHLRFKFDWLDGEDKFLAESWIKSEMQSEDVSHNIQDDAEETPEDDNFFCIARSKSFANSAACEVAQFMKASSS
ncbi:hypothetical protein PR048_017606 [Dryococelus australis]|uniref:Uncharacterized protein n=1 Tax=Dryococelus australis TaxID=614101 RepID=A0ABQ9HA06_9NEOP|nr:hypothetical protein PR048_017606 [Dryococelus australis]